MTVASTLSKAGPYACDGVQTRFPFDFAVLDKKHIAVYINSALVVSGYSVELVEDQEGGTVVMTAPPRAGASLIILRDVPFTQWTDLQNRTAFYPEVLETAYDKLTMICQQLRELLSRVVIVPPGVEPSWEELMDLLTKAGAEAQEAADRAQDILDKILGMGLENMAPLDSPHFTGTPTAPTAGKGTSTDQIATTKFVQNEVADFLSPNQSSFVASQWILDQASSKYYHRIVTDARDISHVYKNEDGGFMVFDDTVEIHVVDEGYIKLVAAAGFDGHIVTLSKRLPVVYRYTPVTNESGQIVSLTLTGIASNPGNITDLDIPSSAEYEGATYPVKKIGDNAFYGSRVTSVNIGEGVEVIGVNAFNSTRQLKKVTFPGTLKTIQGYAFYNSFVEEFKLPDSLVTIERDALSSWKVGVLHIPVNVREIEGYPCRTSTELTEITADADNQYFTALDGVLYTKDMKTLIQYPRGKADASFTIPEGVEELGQGSCYSALNLTNIVLPASLKTIGIECFLQAAKIAAIHLPANVQEIGAHAMAGMTELAAITVDSGNQYFTALDGVLYSKDMKTLVQYPNGKSGTAFTVPDGVETIGGSAFFNNPALTGLTLPVSTVTLEARACSGMYALQNINLPANVQKVGSQALGRCAKLAAITVDSGNQYFTALDGVLYSKDMKTLVQYPNGKSGAAFTVPDGVETIGGSAFYGAKLTGVTLPDGLLTIKEQAFQEAPLLATAAFPTSLSAITDGCYYGCAELAEITFHNPGRWTMDNPFTNCPKLFTVWGYPGSTAEDYAKRYNYLFKSLEEA